MTQTNFHAPTISARYNSTSSSYFLKTVFSFILIIVVFLLLAVSGACIVSGEEPWSQWRGSVGHTGFSSGGIPEDGMLQWRHKTEDQVQSSPVFYNDSMLIGSDDGKLYCLSPYNGKLLWKFKTNGSVQATPLIINDRVYFGSLDGVFYCLDFPDKNDDVTEVHENWSYECGASIISSAHVFEDSLLFGCHDGGLYRLSLSGDFIWRAEIGGEIWASPLIDEVNDRAFIGNINGDFSCIDLNDGNITWSIDAGEIYSSGCLWNGIIYLCGGDNGKLFAINADNGSLIWSFEIGYPAYSTPSFQDGRVYFGSWELTWCLPAVDPNGDGEINTSEIVWSAPTHDEQGGSSPLVTEHHVFIGSNDGNLYCLEKETGSVIWNFTTGGYIYSSPALYRRAIYFGSCDDYIYCLGNRSEGLYFDLELETGEITSDEKLQISITVFDRNGTAIEGAALDIVLSAGEIEVLDGVSDGEGEQILTDSNGKVNILLKPPPVSSRSTIEIKVTVEKSGIQSNEAITYVVVEPGKDAEPDTKPSGQIDLNEKRMPFYTILVLLLFIDLILGLGILKLRNARAKKEIKAEVFNKRG